MVLRGVSKTKRTYDFLVDYMKGHHGVAPSTREICEGVGLASTSTANKILRMLAERKLIAYIRPGVGTARGFYLVGARWVPPGSPTVEGE